MTALFQKNSIIKPFLGIIFLIVLISHTISLNAQVDSTFKSYKMGFFDLNMGADVRLASKWDLNNNLYNNFSSGITARMQSSFIANHLIDFTNRKLIFGDVLAGEFSGGVLVHDKALVSFYPGYRFEFGFGCIRKINVRNDLGLTLTILKFARDNVSPNFAGSNFLIRYRYSRIMIEGGIEARRSRILGWTDLFNKNAFPVQYLFILRYLLPNNKNMGMRIEYLTNNTNVYDDDLNMHKVLSLKIFYGIYF
ncbi:MAG TPA: hypothetical protein VNW99_05455 [Cytophagaceae bacterium]|nr:hypothetical protein [Cytophagaceae bacterium]